MGDVIDFNNAKEQLSPLKDKNGRAVTIASRFGWDIQFDDKSESYVFILNKLLPNGYTFNEEFKIKKTEYIADYLYKKMKNRTARGYCKHNYSGVSDIKRWDVLVMNVRAALLKDSEMIEEFRKENCFSDCPTLA